MSLCPKIENAFNEGHLLRSNLSSTIKDLADFLFLSFLLSQDTARSWALAEIHNRAPIHEHEGVRGGKTFRLTARFFFSFLILGGESSFF